MNEIFITMKCHMSECSDKAIWDCASCGWPFCNPHSEGHNCSGQNPFVPTPEQIAYIQTDFCNDCEERLCCHEISICDKCVDKRREKYFGNKKPLYRLKRDSDGYSYVNTHTWEEWEELLDSFFKSRYKKLDGEYKQWVKDQLLLNLERQSS